MSNVYSIGNNRQLIIYAAGSNIFLRIAHFGGLERPIILATDYMSHLNECIYNDTLYYTYIATDNSLYVKNIMESKSIYTVNGTDTPSLYHPYIGRCNNSLLLFYLKNNPVTNHTALQCISLSLTNESPDNTPVTLPDCMNNITGYHIYQAGNRLILYAAGRIFIIEEIGRDDSTVHSVKLRDFSVDKDISVKGSLLSRCGLYNIIPLEGNSCVFKFGKTKSFVSDINNTSLNNTDVYRKILLRMIMNVLLWLIQDSLYQK